MKIKLESIVSAENSLNKLAALKLPIKAAYTIHQLVTKTKEDMVFFNEKRMELFKEYGTHDKKANTWSIKAENLPAFKEKLNTLLDTEVDIDFQKIKLDDLGTIEIEPNTLIDWMFE